MNGASTFTFLGNSITTLKSSTGTGIWATANWNTGPETKKSGSVALRDNTKVEINTADSPIFGVRSLIIANGDATNPTVNTASLIVNTKGTTKGIANNNTSGTKDSNAVEFTPDATFVANTTGKVSITGTENTLSKTCLRFYGGAVKVIIKCTDFSISGYQNAMGTWHAWTTPSFTYEYTGSYAKMNINTKLIYNTSFAANTTVLGPIFNENTVNFTPLVTE
jgi:hypothetical protein